MYSGFMEVDKDKQLHYVLITSKNDMAKDPLQIWFNGGPGCSSMMGIFQEHGPYVVNDGTDYLVENIWSWNNQANMLYIDQPAGVGWSTCENNCAFTDQQAAKDAVAGLLNWFEKYSDFKTHDLYVSGESYGGVYVPLTSQQMMMHNTATPAPTFTFNLKGFIVGNGVTNWEYDTTPAFVKMGFWHGLYDYDMYLDIQTAKCDYNNFKFGDLSQDCINYLNKFEELTQNINVYDVFRKCYSSTTGLEMYSGDNFGMAKVGNELKPYKKYYTAADYSPWLFDHEPTGGKKNVELIPPCVYGSYVVDYLNRYSVRSAFHIPDNVQAWTYCTDSADWSYTRGEDASFAAYSWFKTNHPDVRILVYSGDTDGSVPTWGTLEWIDALGW